MIQYISISLHPNPKISFAMLTPCEVKFSESDFVKRVFLLCKKSEPLRYIPKYSLFLSPQSALSAREKNALADFADNADKKTDTHILNN